MGKINDYEGFKYYSRLIFEVEASALQAAAINLQKTTNFAKHEADLQKFSDYEFSLEGETIADFAIRGIAVGLLITVDDKIRSYREFLENRLGLENFRLEPFGNKIKGDYWTEGVRACGNYARHQKHWTELAREKAKKCGLMSANGIFRFNKGEFRRLVFPLGNATIDKNIAILEKLGLDIEAMFPCRANEFWRLCKVLKLDSTEETKKNFYAFQDEVERVYSLN